MYLIKEYAFLGLQGATATHRSPWSEIDKEHLINAHKDGSPHHLEIASCQFPIRTTEKPIGLRLANRERKSQEILLRTLVQVREIDICLPYYSTFIIKLDERHYVNFALLLMNVFCSCLTKGF